LLMNSYDAMEEREPWIQNIRLLTESVMPMCNGFESSEVFGR
jgi:hypothetical protein